MGMLVPEEWGGAGVDYGTYALVVEELAAGDASVTIDVPGGGAPLIAGGYSDAVVIELQVEN